ncbi:hypothetical protein OH764_34280 (plasmid) [Burkholderia sp. M6-3]
MNKLFCSTGFVALIITASLFCSATNAAQPNAGASQLEVSQPRQGTSDAAVQQTHGKTRKEVYEQLIEAEEDGSLARLNSTLYGP